MVNSVYIIVKRSRLFSTIEYSIVNNKQMSQPSESTLPIPDASIKKHSEDLRADVSTNHEAFRPTLYVATDGGCQKNGSINSKASYAFVIIDSNNIKLVQERATGVKSTQIQKVIDEFVNDGSIKCVDRHGLVAVTPQLPATNNRGELTAIKEAFDFVTKSEIAGDITWVADSEYSQKSVDVWSRTWIKTPHKLIGKLNLDLILPLNKHIDELRKTRDVRLVHVRSHLKMPEDISSREWVLWFLNDRVDKLCQLEF